MRSRWRTGADFQNAAPIGSNGELRPKESKRGKPLVAIGWPLAVRHGWRLHGNVCRRVTGHPSQPPIWAFSGRMKRWPSGRSAPSGRFPIVPLASLQSADCAEQRLNDLKHVNFNFSPGRNQAQTRLQAGQVAKLQSHTRSLFWLTVLACHRASTRLSK